MVDEKNIDEQTHAFPEKSDCKNSAENPGATSRINHSVAGFRGWADHRLWSALGFYLLSCLLFYQSSIYSSTQFHLFKLFWDMLFALLVMSTICWEWRFFGNINGPNLTGHFGLLFSLTFLFDRFFTRPVEISAASFSGIMGKMLGKTASVIFDSIGDFVTNMLHLPIWIQEIFRSPMLLLLFVLLCFILNLERVKGLHGLFIIFTLYILSTIANPRSGVDIWFFLGIGAMIAGAILQYRNSYTFDFWKTVASRLGKMDNKSNIAAKGAIIKAAYEDHLLTDARARAFVAQYFALDDSSPACYRETTRILKELVIRDAVLSSELTEKGFIFYINPGILENNSLISRFPVYLRSVVIGIVALMWLLMPLDLIPDSIPLIGMIDDLLICFTGGKIINSVFERRQTLSGRRVKQLE